MSRVLEGKRALITGGSRGIGAELARAYAEAGAQVVISGRDEAALIERADQLSAEYGGVSHPDRGGPVRTRMPPSRWPPGLWPCTAGSTS